MRKAKTHFEQIPIEVVKKIIAEQEVPEKKEEGGKDDVIFERPIGKTEPHGMRTDLFRGKGV